jgi:hypothetical protein
MSSRSAPRELNAIEQGAAHSLVGDGATEEGSSPGGLALGVAAVRTWVNRHWEGDVGVGVLSDGTTVRASCANGLSERFQSLLAECGEPRGCFRST